jgi:hypothetical protein
LKTISIVVQDHLLLFSRGQACFGFFALPNDALSSHLSRRCSQQSSTYLRAPLHGCERKKARLAACAKQRVEQKLEKRTHNTPHQGSRAASSHQGSDKRTARGRREPMHHACRSAARSACSPLAANLASGQKQKLLLLHAPAACACSR